MDGYERSHCPLRGCEINREWDPSTNRTLWCSYRRRVCRFREHDSEDGLQAVILAQDSDLIARVVGWALVKVAREHRRPYLPSYAERSASAVCEVSDSQQMELVGLTPLKQALYRSIGEFERGVQYFFQNHRVSASVSFNLGERMRETRRAPSFDLTCERLQPNRLLNIHAEVMRASKRASADARRGDGERRRRCGWYEDFRSRKRNGGLQ